MILLFKITETFTITGIGLVLIPDRKFNALIRAGDAVTLIRQDGAITQTFVSGIVFQTNHISIRGIQQQDAPPGTELWLDN